LGFSSAKRFFKVIYWLLSLQLLARMRERIAASEIAESGLFDREFYQTTYPDLADSKLDPITHFVRYGANEGRSPHPLFDTAYYLGCYPDVVAAKVNPLLHFLRTGAREGRSPHPLFDTKYYLARNSFLASAQLNPLAHYVELGAWTGRNPHPEFDSAWYLETHRDLHRLRLNPLVHYLRQEAAAGRMPNPDRSTQPIASACVPSLDDLPKHADTAVIVHLYYPDVWDELRRYLSNIEQPFDLFVSLCEETGKFFDAQIHRDFPSATVRFFENRGRDVGPFLEFLRDERMLGYTYICKLHSKKSPHRMDGAAWRGDLYRQLLGNPARISEIKDIFDTQPLVGIVGAKDHLESAQESWGSNRKRVLQLASRLGMESRVVRLEFFAGSMFWFRPSAMRPLFELGLSLADFEHEDRQLDGTLAHVIERFFILAVESGNFKAYALPNLTATGLPTTVEREPKSEFYGAPCETNRNLHGKRFKLIAFYLPQFHPIPENDLWWGKGFTEWTNVVKAKPLYEGHIQPRLPADLGFYDLRLPAVRMAQAALAKRYGIHGFCYYYYWFNGKTLLDQPLRQVLTSGEPNFPFCICWANENWTRRWDGLDQEILIEQSYSLESNRQFIRDVIPILRDPRYIRFEGKPVLLIYRVRPIPDLEETVAMWRTECRNLGVGEIHLCAARAWDIVDVHAFGFDAAVDFPPHHLGVQNVSSQMPGLDPKFEGFIYDYDEAVYNDLEKRGHGYAHPAHRGVMLAWDNTPRRGRSAHIAHGAAPESYKNWLSGVMHQECLFNPSKESMIFINAWNEWAEGAVLEPDQHFGLDFLEATLQALKKFDPFPHQ